MSKSKLAINILTDITYQLLEEELKDLYKDTNHIHVLPLIMQINMLQLTLTSFNPANERSTAIERLNKIKIYLLTLMPDQLSMTELALMGAICYLLVVLKED